MIPYHFVTGVGKPLVLANSLGSNLDMWDGQAEELARHFTLIRFDARGHGESAVPPGPYAIEDFGRDVLDLLNHLSLESAHVAGISMGGMIGQTIAIEHPDRIRSLVSMCSTTGSRWVGQPTFKVFAHMLSDAPRERDAFIKRIQRTYALIGSPA